MSVFNAFMYAKRIVFNVSLALIPAFQDLFCFAAGPGRERLLRHDSYFRTTKATRAWLPSNHWCKAWKIFTRTC